MIKNSFRGLENDNFVSSDSFKSIFKENNKEIFLDINSSIKQRLEVNEVIENKNVHGDTKENLTDCEKKQNKKEFEDSNKIRIISEDKNFSEIFVTIKNSLETHSKNKYMIVKNVKNKVRDVLGDGNCLFRAAYFSFFD